MTVTRYEYKRQMRKMTIAFGLLTLLFFVILIGYMLLLSDVRDVSRKAVDIAKNNASLIRENEKRQKLERINVVLACKHTYQGIDEAISIFFHKPPQTEQERELLARFKFRIYQLKEACEKP